MKKFVVKASYLKETLEKAPNGYIFTYLGNFIVKKGKILKDNPDDNKIYFRFNKEYKLPSQLDYSVDANRDIILNLMQKVLQNFGFQRKPVFDSRINAEYEDGVKSAAFFDPISKNIFLHKETLIGGNCDIYHEFKTMMYHEYLHSKEVYNSKEKYNESTYNSNFKGYTFKMHSDVYLGQILSPDFYFLRDNIKEHYIECFLRRLVFHFENIENDTENGFNMIQKALNEVNQKVKNIHILIYKKFISIDSLIFKIKINDKIYITDVFKDLDDPKH